LQIVDDLSFVTRGRSMAGGSGGTPSPRISRLPPPAARALCHLYTIAPSLSPLYLPTTSRREGRRQAHKDIVSTSRAKILSWFAAAPSARRASEHASQGIACALRSPTNALSMRQTSPRGFQRQPAWRKDGVATPVDDCVQRHKLEPGGALGCRQRRRLPAGRRRRRTCTAPKGGGENATG